MDNHYHTVVYIDKEQALKLSDEEVIRRWNILHHLPVLMKKRLEGVELTKAELASARRTVEIWRKRLFGLDWFMKEVNLYMSKRANKEDQCTGHFWESRFKSQALLDEKGLLSAMVYDELNPVRSKSSSTPEQSPHISLKERIKELKNNGQRLPCMHPFMDSAKHLDAAHVPYNLLDYIELVDWTGRQLRADKRGYIDDHLPPILSRISFTKQDWLRIITQLERPRAVMIGTTQMIKLIARNKGQTRTSGYALPD
ncbi:Mobile element protein [Vibrio tapetis]|nr:Mobile element protein [Vibrio tapetis]